MLLAIALPSSAQPEPDAMNNGVEMADVMRQSGKIYVVVAVMLLIFSGLVIYAVRIDQRVSRLEKEIKQEAL